ncbi:MAG: hypothetical protein IPM52_13350 [Bacteroidetes bacterium]|nr:hypothetical protein [Bacteroidota bacterium]
MPRALSVTDMLRRKYELFEFDGEWHDAFGNPERAGTWLIWGNSGNGKTSFVLQLCKYLTRFGRVAYNSLEEGGAHTMHEAFVRHNMAEVRQRLMLIEGETTEQMMIRLKKPRSPEFYVVDSLQYAAISYDEYKTLKDRFGRRKLIIYVSHADGRVPDGRVARRIMYDATMKIWIEGYRAISKGRYTGPNGGIYTIWHEGALKYWGQ